jgi:replicative DNA helicase
MLKAVRSPEQTDGGERIPPQAPDVERTVLGSMMIDANAVVAAIELLNANAFYVTAHRHIFTCMTEMFDNSVPIDVITVADALEKKGLLEAVGAQPYLGELVANVATSANIQYYAQILLDKATLRGLIATSAEITTDCFDSDAEPREILDRAEQRVFSITESRIKGSMESLGQLLPRTFKDIEDYSKGGVYGIPTGFKELDEKTAGLQRGDLVVVAGRPSMGKTALCLSMALHVGTKVGKAVAIFSLEMSKRQLVQRMLCAEARIDMHRLRSGTLPARDHPRLSLAAGPLYEASVFIDDTPGISVLEIRAKARRLKAQGNLDLVIVDYLQLMSSPFRIESRQQEISQISRSLKGLAKELDVPVVALSQLSRAVEQRGGDHKPQLSDLRESGAIEQDADVVMFVYRPEYYDPEDESVNRLAEIIIGKQRNGPTGEVKLTFVREYARFENYSARAEPEF